MKFGCVYFNKLSYISDYTTIAVVSYVFADPVGSNVLIWALLALPQGDTVQFTECSTPYANADTYEHTHIKCSLLIFPMKNNNDHQCLSVLDINTSSN